MTVTYVYFIQQGYGAIKIGVSDDPDQRLLKLQTGTSRALRVIAKFPFSTRAAAFDMERDLHLKFCHLRLSGEWFKRRLLKELKIQGKRVIGGTSKNPIPPDGRFEPKVVDFWSAV
jgi:predicted GIY-YIG superfamily endonuclease